MTRMIERWFPCAEVSANSATGWGSGNTERNLFTWFAARPTAQAKAAVITSLLPWPDDEAEQKRLQDLVRQAMTGRFAAWTDLRAEILREHAAGVEVLDPFSGRGLIPLEAARLGIKAAALDYSPVAVVGSALLTDYPFRDWTDEPPLPFVGPSDQLGLGGNRLLNDVAAVLATVGDRYADSVRPYFPAVAGRQPWAYLWAVTLPCRECGRRFPLVGSLSLQSAIHKRSRSGPGVVLPELSYALIPDLESGTYSVVVHEGPPRGPATLTNAVDDAGRKIPGKSAVCIFCGHVHPTPVHRRMANEQQGADALLLVIDHSDAGAKSFRAPTTDELDAVASASGALAQEPPFSPLVPARPDEGIGPGNNNIIGPSIYGARTYGDLMNDRQTLSFVRLARVISTAGAEMLANGNSIDYARALTAYAAAVMIRRLRRSTRGATLLVYRDGRASGIQNIYLNEGSITFSYDYVETGIGEGSGTWRELADRSLGDLQDLIPQVRGMPVEVTHGSATQLPYKAAAFAAVVTDPPYDEMIAYTDSSDLLYAWLKRALTSTWPEISVTSDALGVQDKVEEIIVKRARGLAKAEYKDHRTREHYDRLIAQSFSEMRRVVGRDGVVTIVFGHGEPEVWQRLLSAISNADLVMTGSWPASTESGGSQGKANIKTTLTMACRPAGSGRPSGRKATVEAEVKAEVKSRIPLWERSALAPTDMLMAAAGPAMEVVGRYAEILDARAEPVDIATFLPLARQAVQEAMAVEVDHHPLETFDARTRFGLWWVRLYGRQVTAKSELRWQSLAAALDLAEVRDLVPDVDKGCQFVRATAFEHRITPDSSVIDVALRMARASEDGLAAVGEVLIESGRDTSDAYLWAAMKFLADRLPDSDPDAIAWTRILRNRNGVGSAARAVVDARLTDERTREADDAQLRLL